MSAHMNDAHASGTGSTWPPCPLPRRRNHKLNLASAEDSRLCYGARFVTHLFSPERRVHSVRISYYGFDTAV